MEQPSSPSAPSYPPNSTLRPRVASRTYSLVHLEDEEATSMPAQIVATLPLKKRPGWPLCCAYLLILVFLSVARSFGQTTAHSPGWVVLPVDEYRTLPAKAYPIEQDREPPPVEATLTRVDYDLRINGELASGRASLTVDVLKNGWVRVSVPAGLLVREARLDGKLVSLVSDASGKAGSQLSALLSHSGRAVLLLDIAIPVATSTGEESISLPPTASGVTRPSVQLLRHVVTGETRSPREGQIDIPLLRLLNAERETGGVAVEVLGAGEIKDLKSDGLDSADATDLGEMVSNRQSPSLAAFRFRSGDGKLTRSLSLNVARYTPQAVLMANVSEARYQVLVSSEGKTLVQARYAVRNNQRNFLKITLPPAATLWSASLAGKAIRPGQSPDGSLLLPLDKARAGEEAPEFAVEVVYLSRGSAWNDKGQFKLALPALDLPVSRTGLLVYHPPLFKVTPEPGTFRTDPYENPLSSALSVTAASGGIAGGMFSTGASSPASPLSLSDSDTKDETKLR